VGSWGGNWLRLRRGWRPFRFGLFFKVGISVTNPFRLKRLIGFGQDLSRPLDRELKAVQDAGNMGGMIGKRKFLFNDPGHHRAGPYPGTKAVSHRARFQNVGQLLALGCGERRGTARAMSFENSLQPLFSPVLQPQANVGTMNFKHIGNFWSGSTFHVESDCVKSVGHPVGAVAQSLLANSNQLSDLFCRSTNLYRSHATSHLSVTCYRCRVIYARLYNSSSNHLLFSCPTEPPEFYSGEILSVVFKRLP
jgi:hypothetical protein